MLYVLGVIVLAQIAAIVAIVLVGLRAWQQREHDINAERQRLLERIQRPEHRPMLVRPAGIPPARSADDNDEAAPNSLAHLVGQVRPARVDVDDATDDED